VTKVSFIAKKVGAGPKLAWNI